MASSGLFLVLFLVIHLCLNATILADDDGLLFTQTVQWLHRGWWLHGLEALLLGMVSLHVCQGIWLTISNRSKRPIGYAVNPTGRLIPAQFMGVLGMIILVFLLLHLGQFWLPGLLSHESGDLYEIVRATFHQRWIIIIYVLGCGAVAAHLSHGWRSALITFGLAEQMINQLQISGIIIAWFIPLGLATIPVWLWLNSHA